MKLCNTKRALIILICVFISKNEAVLNILHHADLSFFCCFAVASNGYDSKMLATTTTMTFNLPLVLSFCSFIKPNIFFSFLFPTNSNREPRNHHHKSLHLHVRNKTPLILVSATVRQFSATKRRCYPSQKLICRFTKAWVMASRSVSTWVGDNSMCMECYRLIKFLIASKSSRMMTSLRRMGLTKATFSLMFRVLNP